MKIFEKKLRKLFIQFTFIKTDIFKTHNGIAAYKSIQNATEVSNHAFSFSHYHNGKEKLDTTKHKMIQLNW